jgi:hypothetical protein
VPAPPSSPTQARAAGNVAKGATVSWAAPAETNGALTEYTVTSAPDGIVTKVAGDKLSAVVTGLKVGTSYTFAVTASNAVGVSPPASTNSVTVLDAEAPVLDSVCPGLAGFVPFFKGVAGADAYNLYYDTAATVSLTSKKIASASSASPASDNVTPGEYWVAVTTVKGAVESQPSTPIKVTVSARAALPETLAISRSGAGIKGGIDLVYDPSVGAGSFQATKTISGDSTGLAGQANGLFLDKATAMLYVLADVGAPRIAVWHDIGGILDGDRAPARVLAGSSTELATGAALTVDTKRNILYAGVRAASAANSRVLAWKNACNVDQNTAPSASFTITGNTQFLEDFALDEANDRLYVAGGTSTARSVFVFDAASQKTTGAIAPSRTITVANATTADNLRTVAYDPNGDFFYVGSNTAASAGRVWRFTTPGTLTGAQSGTQGNTLYANLPNRFRASGGALVMGNANDPATLWLWTKPADFFTGLPTKSGSVRNLAGAADNTAGGIAYAK